MGLGLGLKLKTHNAFLGKSSFYLKKKQKIANSEIKLAFSEVCKQTKIKLGNPGPFLTWTFLFGGVWTCFAQDR